MKYTIEMLHNTEYEKIGKKFVPVQYSVSMETIIDLIGQKLFEETFRDADVCDFSYITTNDHIIRFYI